MSQDADLQMAKKKGEKPGKLPLIDCWAVMDTPLDFSFMKLTTPAGRRSLQIYDSEHVAPLLSFRLSTINHVSYHLLFSATDIIFP